MQTPHFMAPEVAAQTGPLDWCRLLSCCVALRSCFWAEGEDYGPAADIWALGCVVFEMLELGLPYGEVHYGCECTGVRSYIVVPLRRI